MQPKISIEPKNSDLRVALKKSQKILKQNGRKIKTLTFPRAINFWFQKNVGRLV